MIIRQLKQSQYEALTGYLRQHASAAPLDASYTVYMTVNGGEYAVRLQPERHCKIAVLQAYRIARGGEGIAFDLITGGNLLSALLELLLAQEAAS